MRKILVLVAVLGACAGEDPPSCFQAVNNFYDQGCAFVILATGAQAPRNEVIGDCQSGAANTPARCQGELDVWLTCLDSVVGPASTSVCDCSQEQMAYIRCN